MAKMSRKEPESKVTLSVDVPTTGKVGVVQANAANSRANEQSFNGLVGSDLCITASTGMSTRTFRQQNPFVCCYRTAF